MPDFVIIMFFARVMFPFSSTGFQTTNVFGRNVFSCKRIVKIRLFLFFPARTSLSVVSGSEYNLCKIFL